MQSRDLNRLSLFREFSSRRHLSPTPDPLGLMEQAFLFGEDTMKEKKIDMAEVLKVAKVDRDGINETDTLLDMADAMCLTLYESKDGSDQEIFLGLSLIIERAIKDIKSLVAFYDEIKHIEMAAVGGEVSHA
jgi:hypothetical protein